MKNLGALGSSVDPTKISKTVSGFFVAFAVIIIALAQWLGFQITTEEITNFGVQIGSMVSMFLIVYGVIQKIIVAIQQKFKRV